MIGLKSSKYLKPCPFCGNSADILPQRWPPHGTKGFLVRCRECGARMNVFSRYVRSALVAWNQRDQP